METWWSVFGTQALLCRAGQKGEDFSWSFLSPLATAWGRRERGAARGSTRAFFLLTFVSGENGEGKGHKSVQLQSLAGAQAKIAPLFLTGNVLLQRFASAAIHGDCNSLLSRFPGGESCGEEEKGHTKQAWNLVSFYFSKLHVLHLSTSLH